MPVASRRTPAGDTRRHAAGMSRRSRSRPFGLLRVVPVRIRVDLLTTRCDDRRAVAKNVTSGVWDRVQDGSVVIDTTRVVVCGAESMKRSSVCLSVRPSVYPIDRQQRRATGLLLSALWATAPQQAPALSSICGQCHFDSRRRKLNTDLFWRYPILDLRDGVPACDPTLSFSSFG